MALVTLKELMKHTTAERYGVGMFNVVSLEFAEGIISAAEELNSPVMLGLPERFFQFFDMKNMTRLCVDLAERAKVPVAVHLDHGKDFDVILKALRYGFSSVMFDGSLLPYKENVEKTAEIVRIAHKMGVTVEGELGHVGSNVQEADHSVFTTPEEAVDFVERTSVDALAIAIGSMHGVYKEKPQLDYELLKKIRASVDCGLVLHGASGLTDEDLNKLVALGIDKVNIYTDLNIGVMNHVKDALPEAPQWLNITKSMRQVVKEIVMDKMKNLNSVGKVKSFIERGI